MLAERSAQPAVDGGRRVEVGQGPLSRLQVDPMAAFAAATRAPGQHAIVRFTF